RALPFAVQKSDAAAGKDNNGKERAHEWNQVIHLAVVFRGNWSGQVSLPIQHKIAFGDSYAAPFKGRLYIVRKAVQRQLASKRALIGTSRRHFFQSAGLLVQMADSNPLIALRFQVKEELHRPVGSPAGVCQRRISMTALHSRCVFREAILGVLLENS